MSVVKLTECTLIKQSGDCRDGVETNEVIPFIKMSWYRLMNSC